MKDFKHTHKMHHGHHPVFGSGPRPSNDSAIPPMAPPGGMGGIQSAGEDMASSAPGGMGAGNSASSMGAGYRRGGMAKGGKWIQKAIKHPSALHEQLGVPKGEKIPAKKLEKASHASGKLGKRARLAMTLKGMK